jgi:hypothetical protein
MDEPSVIALPLKGHAYPADGREIVAILAVSGVVISSWALMPASVESGSYVPLPAVSAPSASVMDPAELATGAGLPSITLALNNSDVVANPMSVAGSSGIRYASSAIDVTVIPIRSKLEALLRVLYAQSGEFDRAQLEAKINALLKLPDSVLARLLEHPDLQDLNTMLDSVFYGTSDVRDVMSQLDKVDVASVPGSSDQVQVVKVSGNVVYMVRTPAVDEGLATSIMAAESSPVAPDGATMTVTSQFDQLAGVFVSIFTAPVPLPPLPAPAPMAMMAQVDPAPAPAAAPSSVKPAAPPSLSPPPSPEPTHTPTPSVEPIRHGSDDEVTSGDKVDLGETVQQQQQIVDSSPSAGSPDTPETQSSSPAPDRTEPTGAPGGGEPASDGPEGGGGTSPEGGINP